MGKVLDLRELQEAGGYIEGSHGSEGTKNLQIYTTESGKKSIYPNAESIPNTASIVFDAESGDITVNIPEKWKNDEQVKKYTDNYILTTISGNYKNNKDVEYQDPFDETKKVKTEEWIKEVNDALQFQVAALNATAPTKTRVISRYGGTESKNNVINGMTTNDIIVMSANFDDDDSWVPMPAYMLLAYPEIENLESYTNGWVKKNDFMDNIYNIESGKITEQNALGIASTPEKMLANIEDMTPEEAAKTIAFGRFISQVDPKRSNWEQFLQAGDALGKGFYGGFYDWFVETSDMLVNLVSLSWITGNSVETRGFWNGILSFGAGDEWAFDATEYLGKNMQRMALTNKDALSKAQAGYVQGRLAGQAVDAVVSTVAIGEATRMLSNAITTRITSKGATTLADKMTKATTATSSSTALTTAERAEASALADTIKNMESFKNAAAGSANYQRFFSQTLSGALNLYNKSVSATSIALEAMDSAKFASIVNSASRIATTANLANTAVNVLGNMVIAAVIGNKELTTKVLSSKATSDEAKSWIQQVLWDTAKISAFSYATNIAYETFGNPLKGSKAEAWARNMKQKASQKFTKFSEKMSSPWLNFMKWYNDNRAAAAKSATGAAANARASRGEAIKEAVLANEARAYGANLSTEPGSYGTRLIEEALLETNTRPGVTMSETLQNLARAGVVFDPANLNLSEYEAWQANMSGFRNALTNWEAIDVNISQVVNEFNNPNIQPVISQQLSEMNKANSDMLNLEKAQGLLSKDEIKRNKSLLKNDEGALYAMHSPQLARYIVRGYEMKIIGNEGRRLGHENLDEYKPYVEAKERWIKAADGLAPKLREIADTRYVPALAKAEHNIMDIMVNDGVFPRAFVEAMRASGKFGNNGEDWLRLVSRKDTPKGVYSPFSGTVKEDNVLAINRFKVLDDEDITWPGNGLTELIEEYGVSRAEKTFLKEHKAATGKTTEIVVSGEKTRSAGLMKEFKDDLNTAVRQGLKSFVHTASGTVAIGKKRSAEQLAFLKEVADVGGVETIDIDTLRVVMREKGVPLAETIVDQESLDKFLETASDEAKKIFVDTVGEKTYGNIVSNYTENTSLGTLEKRKNIADIDNEIAIFKKNSDAYTAGINYGGMDTSSAPKSGKKNLEKFIKEKVEAGKKAAKALGYRGKPEKFDAWAEKKLASLNKKREALIDEVLNERGTKRPTIKFNSDLYGSNVSDVEYIKKRSDRQKISDKILGPWNGNKGDELSQRWLVEEDVSAKVPIRSAIESNPELRSATLSTMYDNSGSELTFEEWLDTPISLTRQQKVDSLRDEDAFLSFSMNKNWTGTNDPDPDGSALTGDLITLEVKPKDTLGQIPQNIDNEGEAEVLVPREVYATAMSDYDRAISGLSDTSGDDIDAALENAIKNEQFNKLTELKESNLDEYENLLDELDRANAKVSEDVKNSEEIQVAADQYRSNKKDFEKSVLFNQKFSYIIKSETTKNTLTAFAKENGIKLEEGKASTKAKLKSALWKKVVNGEDLPTIKGIRKSDIKSIKDVLSAVNNDENVVKSLKKNFYSMLENTDLFKNSGGPNPLKYELDKDTLLNDIDVAIDDMLTRMKLESGAEAAVRGMAEYQGYGMSEARFEFTALSHVLSKENSKELSDTVSKLARTIVDNLIPRNSIIIKGNEAALYKQVKDAIMTKLESRFSTAKTLLETMGEEVESPTITELLSKHAEEITGAKSDPLVIKTTDANGEVQYERVTPALADIYNARPTYSPMSTPMKILNNLALLKKINQTDLNPRSFAKQTASDPAMAFVTVGALPGTLHALRDEITRRFGPALLRQIEKNDPIRFSNIKAIAEREGVSMEKAFEINSEAIAKTQVPFTLLNNEILRQASISKFGNEGAIKMGRKNLNEKINSGLRKASEKLGWAQNKRETYVRLYAGEKAFMDALRKGYNLEQAEKFREYALNTATTNFRSKHTMFNLLRSTTPYLTSGISGAKSFWQMFEMDPIGVTSRIFTGFIAPILYFAGEIFSDENLKKKYEALSESEKENHIVIAIAGELTLIPVGEEIGKYTNMIMHAVEALYNENQYDFWSLMLNDTVGLIPGADFTGFTDPEMWNDLSGQAPTFLDVMENGISKMLSSTAPPIVQSGIMLATGRDLYTGRKINNSYITIDEEGNPVIMSTSTSEFAQALAKVVGGDAKVIEKIVSGSVGTVALHTLDVLTSAVQYIVPGGEEGSLTTAFDKTASDLSAPFVANGYNSLERRFNYGVSRMYDEKESIEKDDRYIKYNQEIASERDSKKRQTLINKRNELFADYMKRVEALIKGYRTAGGMLDKWKFSKAVSLITFEDAIRADRQFMDINTNYSDAYKQAMQSLYAMGITNPDGPSSLGYIYTDSNGEPQLKMWTPVQMQILQNQFSEQGNIHAAKIKAILDDGSKNSIKKQYKLESEAERPYWDKYNANGKLSNAEWDAIDDLRKAHNAKVVLALKEYMDTYGTVNVLSNDEVIDAIKEFIQVPSSYETVKGRYISSGNGKLDKKEGFKESYIKTIFGVR